MNYDLKTRLGASLERFIGQVQPPEIALVNVQAAIKNTFRDLEAEGKLSPDELLCEVEFDKTNPTQMLLYVGRNYAKYPASAWEFEEITGRPPVQDDLHRLNCDQAGTTGHMACGFCLRTQKPRFMCTCGCITIWRH